MALVSGVRSSLNPNAPLFVPAALRQVEDFSPEWWELVKTSAWFRDYWLSQHREEDFDGSADAYVDDEAFDIADMGQDTFDLGLDVGFSDLDIGFSDLDIDLEGFAFSSEGKGETKQSPAANTNGTRPLDGPQMDIKTLLLKSSKESQSKWEAVPAKYREKPTQCVSPKFTPWRIHQPR